MLLKYKDKNTQRQTQTHYRLPLSMDHDKIFAMVRSQGSNSTWSHVLWKFSLVTMDDSFVLKNTLGYTIGCLYRCIQCILKQRYISQEKKGLPLSPELQRYTEWPRLPSGCPRTEWLLHCQEEELGMSGAGDPIRWNNHSFLCCSGNGS